MVHVYTKKIPELGPFVNRFPQVFEYFVDAISNKGLVICFVLGSIRQPQPGSPFYKLRDVTLEPKRVVARSIFYLASRFIEALLRLCKVWRLDRKSTRLNSSHLGISYAVFCL